MSARASRWPYALLIIPFVGTLYVPLYDHVHPTVLGFPFFYWYQLAWVPISVLVTGIVYRLLRLHTHKSHEAGS
ncbi:DUF3311 domain-containing protein [Acidiferrobacter sp.]|uniref:DUF3311 domain-containing protein n=1 Tax=Acidiferrobacter sp. TaxID=1872107 RepID=UPI002615F112|nr:DUF3311 domain-containing protein [Acidiferrobacter sp.]